MSQLSKVAIGVDIGGSHVMSKAVDILSGEIIHQTEAHSKLNGKAPKDEVFQAWANTINKTIALCSNFDIAGIGFAMPGAFNYADGVALFNKGNDKYNALYGLKVSDHLGPLLILPELPLRFHNDATCFAIGEDGFGLAKSHNRSIIITLGTGFGSAFIDDGVPIVVREDVPEDGCLWHLKFKNGIADEYFSTRWFVRAFEDAFEEKLSGVKEIVDRRKKDENVQIIFDSFGENLATLLAPWVQKFQPTILILGGNISGAYPYFSSSLAHGLARVDINLRIQVSTLKEDAAILGSARLLDDNYFTKIKDFLPTK